MRRYFIPPAPEVPAEQRGRGTVRLRFEDLAQDGRLVLASIANGLSEAVWSRLLGSSWSQAAMAQGLVPILARAVLLGDPGPFAINADHQAEGCWALGHTVDSGGAVQRLVLNMWVELHGPRGVTYGGPPDGAGERIRSGRMYAEHVMTRLFAGPEDRKVTRLGLPGLEDVPAQRFHWTLPHEVSSLPEGATPLDPDWVVEPQPYVFGLLHTDVNQHVNSLVYPRVMEAAAIRRFAALGLPTDVLSRCAELAFRKPAFAGEALRVALRAYRRDDRCGVVGIFFDEAAGPSRPRTHVALEFDR